MSTLSYKCPSCGAPLTYDGRQQEMTCGSCGNTFDPETIRTVSEIAREDAGHEDMRWQMESGAFSENELEKTRTYSCSSCGAQLFTEETTVATECAFCGSPSVIPAQFTPGTKPEAIIPKIVEGYMKKFKDEKVLLNQKYIRDESKTVADLITDKVSSLGENLIVRRFVRWSLGETTQPQEPAE